MIVMCDVTYIDKMSNATYIEHCVMDMLEGKHRLLALYLWLKRFHNKAEGYAYPNIRHNKRTNPNPTTKDLVTLMGCSDNTIVKMLNELEEMQLIEKIQLDRGNGARLKNVYKVYQPYDIEDKYFDVIFEEDKMKIKKFPTSAKVEN